MTDEARAADLDGAARTAIEDPPTRCCRSARPNRRPCSWRKDALQQREFASGRRWGVGRRRPLGGSAARVPTIPGRAASRHRPHTRSCPARSRGRRANGLEPAAVRESAAPYPRRWRPTQSPPAPMPSCRPPKRSSTVVRWATLCEPAGSTDRIGPRSKTPSPRSSSTSTTSNAASTIERPMTERPDPDTADLGDLDEHWRPGAPVPHREPRRGRAT